MRERELEGEREKIEAKRRRWEEEEMDVRRVSFFVSLYLSFSRRDEKRREGKGRKMGS